MRKHSDIALLRKMIQQKFKGVSETPPVDGFEEIQSLLAQRKPGLTKVNKLFIGLAILSAVAISSALYFKDAPVSSMANELNSSEDMNLASIKTDSSELKHHGRHTSTVPKRRLKLSLDTNPSTKQNEALDNKSNTGRPTIESDKEKAIDTDLGESIILTEKTVSDLSAPVKEGAHAPSYITRSNSNETRVLSSLSNKKPLIPRSESISGIQFGNVTNLRADYNTSPDLQSSSSSPFNLSSNASKEIITKEDVQLLKFIKPDEDLLKPLMSKNILFESTMIDTALSISYGRRIKYFYEVQTFSNYFTLKDIDPENFISYNQNLAWSIDNLGIRLGVGMNYVLIKGVSFNAGIRYTHFSKEINYDVGKRVIDASIPINDQQVPVYHIVENRSDIIRHFGIGIHAGVQVKFGNRYLGVEMDYSKSLANSTIGTTSLLVNGYLKLGSFWFKKDIAIVELQASRGLSSWKNDLIEYHLKQIGITLKYPIKSRK